MPSPSGTVPALFLSAPSGRSRSAVPSLVAFSGGGLLAGGSPVRARLQLALEVLNVRTAVSSPHRAEVGP